MALKLGERRRSVFRELTFSTLLARRSVLEPNGADVPFGWAVRRGSFSYKSKPISLDSPSVDRAENTAFFRSSTLRIK